MYSGFLSLTPPNPVPSPIMMFHCEVDSQFNTKMIGKFVS